MRNRLKLMLITSLMVNILFILGTIGVVIKSGGITQITSRVETVFNNKPAVKPYYYDRKEHFETLPIKKNSIVFLGDSLTDYAEWSELFPSQTIYNRGIAADTTSGILNRLKEIVESQPSKLFVMAGINDLDKNIPIPDVVSNYQKILGQIKTSSPSTEVYIQSILPINSSLTASRMNSEKIIAVNQSLKELAEKSDYVYVDLYSKLSNENQLDSTYTRDGVHLNGRGYVIWKKEIEHYVNTIK